MATLEGIKNKCAVVNGCWLWKGSVNNDQYPTVRHGDKVTLVARTAWELANDKEFPFYCHATKSCGQKQCVNPQHIVPREPGKTTREQRYQIKRAEIGEDGDYASQAILADQFKVTRSRVSQVRNKS